MKNLSPLLLIATVLCVTPACAVLAATENNESSLNNMIQDQEQARQDLNRRIQEYNKIEQQKAREGQTILGRLTKLKQDAQSAKDQMAKLEGENARLKKLITDLDSNIKSTTSTIKDLVARLHERVIDMYKFSSREDLHILLLSRDTHEALITAYMLDCIERQEQGLLEALTARIDDLKGLRVTLSTSQEQVRVQSDELKKKRAEFDNTIKQTNTLLKNVRSQQKQAHNAAAELEAAEREVGSRIVALTAERNKLRANQAAPEQPQSPQPVKEVKGQKQEPAKQQQKASPQHYAWLSPGTPLEWPIRGKITTSFGSHVHPVFNTKVFNSGIDIKASAGMPVKSAGPGEVLFTGWIRGLGQVVIVNHGNDLATVYAQLATASVREGDAVRTGSTLGTVGNSGTSSDYELHFEVRKGGTAQNPVSYLKKA